MVAVQAQFGSMTFGQGCFMSNKVICVFCLQHLIETRQSDADCPIVFNWPNRIDWCAYWHSSVIIWPQAHETWGHLRSKFDWFFDWNLTFSQIQCNSMFRCVSTRETYWSSNYFSNVLCSKVINEIILLFEVVDLTLKVNSTPRVSKMYAIGFVSSQVVQVVTGRTVPRSFFTAKLWLI